LFSLSLFLEWLWWLWLQHFGVGRSSFFSAWLTAGFVAAPWRLCGGKGFGRCAGTGVVWVKDFQIFSAACCV
jgi:hypothetical protein